MNMGSKEKLSYQNFNLDIENFQSSIDILNESYTHSVSGGKKIRPLLCLKLTQSLNGDLENAKIFSKAIEAYHNFSLVHDDIIDEDEQRRGKKATWKKYGLNHGINTGDAIHSQSYSYLLEHQENFDDQKLIRLLEILNKADKNVLEGQAMDLSFRDREEIKEEEYMKMVKLKTGSLIRASLEGSIVMSNTPSIKENIAEFGSLIGPAFQIRDDVIDIKGDKGREDRGMDIKEGKRSIIVVYALKELNEKDSNRLMEILNKEREKTTQEEVEECIELFESVNAIEKANKKAIELKETAINELNKIEKYELEDIKEITEFLVERKF